MNVNLPGGIETTMADSRVVFASKAFPCTAVQRVMVQEGSGWTLPAAGRSSPHSRPAWTRRLSCCTATPRDRKAHHGGRERDRAGGGGRPRRRRPAGVHRAGRQLPGRPGTSHSGRNRRHPRPRADRSRGLEVRALTGGGRTN